MDDYSYFPWFIIITMPAVLMFLIFITVFSCISFVMWITGQKTRNPQRRRMYVGSRSRPSLTPAEPTIYVSPANLPPPPKYEALAPPSYEEVVGVHYPSYQPQVQPITAPITTALAQSSSNSSSPPEYNEIPIPAPAVITVTSEERRPSAPVARS